MTDSKLSREQLLALLDLQDLWRAAQERLRIVQDECKITTGPDLVDALRRRARAGEAAAKASSNYFNSRADYLEALTQTQNSSDV